MPPPPQQPQQAFPQQGQPSVPQQLIPTIRPRPVIDLTNSDDERVPKRPRMPSDPSASALRSPRPTNHPRHPLYAQMPYQTHQQRNQQSGLQVVPMDHAQNQPMQPYYPRRSVTAPMVPYQHVPSPTSPPYVGPFRTNSLPEITASIPAPPISAPPVMDVYRAVTGEQGATQTEVQLPDVHGQVQGVDQLRRADTGPAHHANAASQIGTADAGTNVATTTNPAETPAERSTGTPLASTPATPPPDSVPVSPQVLTGQTQAGGSSLPPLTEEQTKLMRSELADSMFTEPGEDDEKQARVCVFCQ
jgi:hypothetical protein